MTQQITNTDRVALLLKPYLTTNDLMRWYGKGRTYCQDKMREMHLQVIKAGKKTVRGTISTAAFMEYEGIDLNHYVALAKIEKELGI